MAGLQMHQSGKVWDVFWVQSTFDHGWGTGEVRGGNVRPERQVQAQLCGMLRGVDRGGSYSALKVREQTSDVSAPSCRTGRPQWVDEMGTEIARLVKDCALVLLSPNLV